MRISLARRSSRFSRSSVFRLTLFAAQQLTALAFISFGLANPLAQRLMVDAEVAGDVGSRAAGVEDHPGTAIEQLFGVFLLSWHGLIGSLPPGGILASRSPSNPAWLISGATNRLHSRSSMAGGRREEPPTKTQARPRAPLRPRCLFRPICHMLGAIVRHIGTGTCSDWLRGSCRGGDGRSRCGKSLGRPCSLGTRLRPAPV